MPFAILHRSRLGSLGLAAVLIMSAGAAIAQDAPSNTAAGRDGATPVLLGNNARTTGTSPIATGAQVGVAPITIVTPRASSGDEENPFKKLMDRVNNSMSTNANAAAAEREKKLAAEAEARNAEYRRRSQLQDPHNRAGNNKPQTDTGTIIMRDAEPNDRGAPPSHTFTIE